ncbi:MAG: hypothetical protein ACRDHU_14665, partial [Actinomycetota bacterium]
MAETTELPPGASYRVHAEWGVLDPLSAVAESEGPARGVALLRPGVEYEAREGGVEIGTRALLVDRGARAHDPWRPIGGLDVASELGRPPFPRRPVVTFLSCDVEAGLAEWARKLVNRLVRRDVEARLAMPDVAEGLHLTRPCLPCEASVQALAPDVLITLDESAVAHAQSWCGTARSTVIVELVPELPEPVHLLPWQIGRASGRLRAQINRRVNANALVALVHRLCAGPHPMPPVDRAEPAEGEARPVTGRQRSCAVVMRADGNHISSRSQGLVDHLSAGGITTELMPTSRDPNVPAALAADLVVLIGAHDEESIVDLIATRRAAGRPTVVDIVPTDLARVNGT